MKTLRLLLLSAALTMVCTAPSLAADDFSTAFDLYSHWQDSRTNREDSPYPSYICGVWSTDGSTKNLTFAVTKDEAGEAGKAEILELVEDDSTVSFAYQTYPYEELWAMQLALEPSLGEATGAYAIGVSEMENVLTVYINTDNASSQVFMEECLKTYGDRIRFEAGSGITFTLEEKPGGGTNIGFSPSGGGSGKDAQSVWLWLFAVILAMLGAAAWSGHLPLLQTAGGKAVSARPHLSFRATVKAVQQNSCAPPPKVRQAILQEIARDTESD